MSTCPCTRTRRRDVVAGIARDARHRYLIFALRVAHDLLEAARFAPPAERDELRELARTLRAGARFAQRGGQ